MELLAARLGVKI
jgi:hypothetical protein